MKRILIYFVVVFIAAFASVAVYAQVQYKRAEGYLPEVVTISKYVPNTGRVCVEPPDGGLMNCRSIGELRKWARERAAK